jgi:hypothetical protein
MPNLSPSKRTIVLPLLIDVDDMADTLIDGLVEDGIEREKGGRDGWMVGSDPSRALYTRSRSEDQIVVR